MTSREEKLQLIREARMQWKVLFDWPTGGCVFGFYNGVSDVEEHVVYTLHPARFVHWAMLHDEAQVRRAREVLSEVGAKNVRVMRRVSSSTDWADANN